MTRRVRGVLVVGLLAAGCGGSSGHSSATAPVAVDNHEACTVFEHYTDMFALSVAKTLKHSTNVGDVGNLLPEVQHAQALATPNGSLATHLNNAMSALHQLQRDGGSRQAKVDFLHASFDLHQDCAALGVGLGPSP